ncbi:MAG: DUF3754 domain-containing protein [Rhodospirillaceae bacterium]|nr:DUF3754 domain-containing protein [Rhodospirillaceae bacterium]
MDGDSLASAHYIPFRRRDIVDMCADERARNTGDATAFRQCADLLTSLIHYEFHVRLEALKDAYAPVAADADTRAPTGLPGTSAEADHVSLVQSLKEVLQHANFEQVSRAELHKAMNEESIFKVRLHVNYDDFEEVLVFKRGESMRSETIPIWFGLKRRSVTFVNYDRVLIYVRFKGPEHFRRRKKLLFKPGSVFIKLFQNIPKADIEMLFPNAAVRMKAVDKLFIGVPALVSGVVVAVTKLGATAVLIGALVAFWLGLRKDEVKLDQAALLGLAAGLFAVGGFLWRQFSNFRNRKIQFLKMLADNLYFKKLDTNAGVFHRLIDAAEEEECKETLLAYCFLLRAAGPADADMLDRAIEAWFLEKWQCRLDFEIDDALRKLVRYGLAEVEEGRYRAVAPAEARRRLDRKWDDLFDGGAPPSEPAAPPRQPLAVG